MNEREVADYLLSHPEFFENQAELLGSVRLTSPHGTRAVSLQERQMEMLREKNKLIERRLAELLRYGHENDGIAHSFNRWTAHILAERDPHALPRAVVAGLLDIFKVPSAAVRLWDVAEPYALADFARATSEELRTFAHSQSTPYCGANTGFEAAQWLSADYASAPGGAEAAPAIASVALITLRVPSLIGRPGGAAENTGEEAFGLLVMGSPEARRFHEGMSTDFLSQIGVLASAALSRLLPR